MKMIYYLSIHIGLTKITDELNKIEVIIEFTYEVETNNTLLFCKYIIVI